MAKTRSKPKPAVDGELINFASMLSDDQSRIVFADFLDERYPATLVKRNVTPVGFIDWWRKRGHHRRWPRSYGWGRLAHGDVIEALRCVLDDYRYWIDHPGATVIGGVPVFVGEPYRRDESVALAEAALLQERLGCPVSYSRSAHHAPFSYRCVRFAVWFTVSLKKPV